MSDDPQTADRNRSVLVILGAVAAVVVVVLGGVWIFGSPSEQPPRPATEANSEGIIDDPERTATQLEPDASAYAAAITEIAQVAGARGKRSPVYIVDHTCANIPDPSATEAGCDPQDLSGELRRGLERELSDFGKVKFVGSKTDVYDVHAEPAVRGGGVVVELGRAAISGSTAEVPVQAWISGDGAAGATYKLRDDGRWRIADSGGVSWIA